MKIVVLASGSEGNSTFFSDGTTRILIDIGKNAKYIKDQLKNIHEEASNIQAIVISHTHDDHVSALRVFLKSNHPIVFVTRVMFQELECLQDYDNVVFFDEDFNIGGFHVTDRKSVV